MPPKKRKIVKFKDVPKDAPSDSNTSGDEDEDGLRPYQRQRKGQINHGLVSTFFTPHRAGSTRSVSDLNIAAGDEGSLRSLVASLPERFPNEKNALRRRLESQFGKWWAQWRTGHSLLFYGFGSKRALLQKFATKCSSDGACLSVNGMQPDISARQILLWTAGLATMVKPTNYRSTSTADLLDLVIEQHPTRQIYLVIHNIDGPGLRHSNGQRLLSELAALPNVHLAASIDHVNAPLLWDLQTKDRFAWLWHQIPTFQPYVDEVAAAAVPSLLVGRKEACTQQSALVVLSSLSHTAREVFRLIADAQLDPSGAGGITFQRLFTSCRERFLVSNEMLLKAFLTEFRDHDILQSKRGQDGGDVLCVPLDVEALQQVLSGMEGAS